MHTPTTDAASRGAPTTVTTIETMTHSAAPAPAKDVTTATETIDV